MVGEEPFAIPKLPNDRYLAEMTKRIFQAGFSWKVIEQKWDGFEAAFDGFDINTCRFMSPDIFEALCQDTRIVRNGQKIETVPQNAEMIFSKSETMGSFFNFLKTWPEDDYVGLLLDLKKSGARLGGMTCQYFLRSIGYDSFIFGRDGVAALISVGVIDKHPTSKKALQTVQATLNAWREETGYSLTTLSRVCAMSIDA